MRLLLASPPRDDLIFVFFFREIFNNIIVGLTCMMETCAFPMKKRYRLPDLASSCLAIRRLIKSKKFIKIYNK